jgi:hypothetical protein
MAESFAKRMGEREWLKQNIDPNSAAAAVAATAVT